MANLNSYTYICSAGLASVTSAGTLGPYFALTHFLPVYDFRLDKNICDTSAINVSSLNYTSATHSSLSALEIIYNNPELSGLGSYSIAQFNSLYYRGVVGTGPLFTGTKQKIGTNKVNILNGKVLQPQVSAANFVNTGTPGALSATGPYQLLNNGNVLSWNPLSGASSSWKYNNLYRVTSYSPNANTSPGICKGNYKCRIPAGTGSFKFNMLAIYATRVNQYGYYDPGAIGSPYNPTLFAIVCFDTPQEKYDVAGSMNAFEANVELQFALQSSAASPVYLNTDYFTRIPTSNSTSAYALNYDGDVVISCSANPGSWVPRAKLTVTDSEKNQVHLAYDDLRYTTITTESFKPYDIYPDYYKMAVLNIDTACPDDSLIQAGTNCKATGIKSVALGCYTSATGYSDHGDWDYEQDIPNPDDLYKEQRGGYTFSYGVENISQGLASTSFGYGVSAVGFGSFAGGHLSIASSDMLVGKMYDLAPSEGMNFAYGFKTSAIGSGETHNPDGTGLSTLTSWFSGLDIFGGNFASNIMTLAKGNGCAAYNIKTIAYGTANTSFGVNTSAVGNITFVTGMNSVASNILSQAHGYKTSATSILSYVYGSNAIADESARGSFTFGGPSIDSYSESFNYTSPGYRTLSVSNGIDVESLVTPVYNTVSQYLKTYNNGYGSFVFGLGSSATSYANNTFVFGLKNNASGKYSSIFGNNNTLDSGSDYMSVRGDSNKVVISKYSVIDGYLNTVNYVDYASVKGINNSVISSSRTRVDGFSNKVTKDDQTYVFGSDNTVEKTKLNVLIGCQTSLQNNINSFSIGNYNSISNSTNSYAIGTSNNISTSVNSYAIGNAAKIAGSTNSMAIGYNATVTTNNSIQIGSCSVETLTLTSPNIYINAKTGCNNSSNSKIKLEADSIELIGYDGNRETSEYKLLFWKAGRTLYSKVYKYRKDNYSGEVYASLFRLQQQTTGTYLVTKKRITPSVTAAGLTSETITSPIKSIYLNTDDLEFKFLTSVDNENDYIGKQWHKLVSHSDNVYSYTGVSLIPFNRLVELKVLSDGDSTDQASLRLEFSWVKNGKQNYFTSDIQSDNCFIGVQSPYDSVDNTIDFVFSPRKYNAWSFSTNGENVLASKLPKPYFEMGVLKNASLVDGKINIDTSATVSIKNLVSSENFDI